MKRSERGQGIAEFAVIFPIFAIFVFLMIDGGLLMGRYNVVNQSAREGSRLGAAGATEQEIVARVKAQAQGLLDDVPANGNCGASGDMICVQWLDVDDGPVDRDAGEVGSTVRVRVRYEYDLITPLASGSILGVGLPGLAGGFDVEACSIARLEAPLTFNLGGGDVGSGDC